MKHTLNVTIIILFIFLLTQMVGLGLILKDGNIETTANVTIVSHNDTVIGERPETEGGDSVLLIMIMLTISTGLFLLIVKFSKIKLWKTWFFIAVWLSISIALGVLINPIFALMLGALLATVKLFGRNVFIYNLGEVLMYSGLGVLFVPLFDLFWIFILLILISGYDAFAVWKSKHMVKMAEFQTKSQLFSGITIPYNIKKGIIPKLTKSSKLTSEKSNNKLAILGGGDVVFTLFFAGTVMEWFLTKGLTNLASYSLALLTSIFAMLGLTFLFYKSKKNVFYPAMPFISMGCFIGFSISYLIYLFI